MPELPEVEAICRRLQEAAAGTTILAAHIDRPQTTRPVKPQSIARKLVGRRIDRVERRAKNVLIRLDDGRTLRIHLRMTGHLWVAEPDQRPPMARAWFVLDNGRELVYEDMRLLGHMTLLSPKESERLDEILGIEPLSATFTPEYLAALALKSRLPAKLFLMDQSRVVGLGNIWAAEALFEARINPVVPMNSLKRKKLASLHTAIVQILTSAVESAYRYYSAGQRTPEGEGLEMAVYDREGQPCFRCWRTIRRITQGGRSTYFCPGCQR